MVDKHDSNSEPLKTLPIRGGVTFPASYDGPHHVMGLVQIRSRGHLYDLLAKRLPSPKWKRGQLFKLRDQSQLLVYRDEIGLYHCC